MYDKENSKKMDWIKIHALADGELSAEEAKALMQELELDPAAKAEYQSILALKLTIREKSVVYTNDALMATCVKRFAEIDRSKRVDGFVAKYAWGLCGAFLVTIIVAGSAKRLTTVDSTSPVVIGRNTAMVPIPGLRTLRQAANAVKNKFQTWVKAGDSLQLIKASEGTIGSYPAMRLELADSIGPVTLYVTPNQPLAGIKPMGNTGYHSGTGQEGNVVAWSRDGNLFILTAQDRSVNDLLRVAERL